MRLTIDETDLEEEEDQNICETGGKRDVDISKPLRQRKSLLMTTFSPKKWKGNLSAERGQAVNKCCEDNGASLEY